MPLRTLAVSLKIPDNAAFTAMVALRRLGVPIERLERSDVWQLEDEGQTDLRERFERNEAAFNPNKHVLQVLDDPRPREGEVWIEPLDAADAALRVTGVKRARRYTGWRLFRTQREPADRSVVEEAVRKLLCNPAIERALY